VVGGDGSRIPDELKTASLASAGVPAWVSSLLDGGEHGPAMRRLHDYYSSFDDRQGISVNALYRLASEAGNAILTLFSRQLTLFHK